MSQAPNLLDKLEKWATETPDKIAMSFLDDKGDILPKSSMTYSDVAIQSSNLAEYLRSPESNMKSGDRSVMVVFEEIVRLLTVKSYKKFSLFAIVGFCSYIHPLSISLWPFWAVSKPA